MRTRDLGTNSSPHMAIFQYLFCLMFLHVFRRTRFPANTFSGEHVFRRIRFPANTFSGEHVFRLFLESRFICFTNHICMLAGYVGGICWRDMSAGYQSKRYVRENYTSARCIRESYVREMHPRCIRESYAPRSSLLAPRSSLLAPRSSLLAPRSSLLAPRSSLLAPRSSLLAPRSSLEPDNMLHESKYLSKVEHM